MQVSAAMGVLALIIALIDNGGDGPDGLVLPSLILPAALLLIHAFVARIPLPVLLLGIVTPASVVFFLGYAEGSMFFVSLAALLATYSAKDRRLANVVCIAFSAIPVVAGLTSNTDSGWGFWFFGVLLGWLFGNMARINSDLVVELEQQRAHVAAQAVVEERRRIARDIHDLVGHSLTVVLLHVTGARRALRRNPESAEEALASAEKVGRDSLAEIRRSVSLLRTDESIDTQPAPTASDIRQLVANGQAAGQNIDLAVSGDLNALSGSTGLTAYRIVQESLSNAAKHAAGALIDVDIVVTDKEICLGIENERRVAPTGADRSGYGLIGMRERVQAVGGTLVVGPAGGCWRVDVTLPREHLGATP